MRLPAAECDPSSFLVGVFDGHGRNGEIISAYCQVTPCTCAFKLCAMVNFRAAERDGDVGRGASVGEGRRWR